MIEDAKMHFKNVGDFLNGCEFRQAIMSAMELAHDANRYLEKTSPWEVIKKDKQAAANSLYVALCLISYLRTMLYPFLPFSSQKLNRLLGFEKRVEEYEWKPSIPKPGQKLLPPEPLFSKLDEKLVEEEAGRLRQV
jgi:methionyl-tRNA synthetase